MCPRRGQLAIGPQARLLAEGGFEPGFEPSSWLNMVEIEIGVMVSQCLVSRRIARDLLKLSNADPYAPAQHPRRRSHCREPATPDGLGFSREPEACLPLVHCRRQQGELLRDLRYT